MAQSLPMVKAFRCAERVTDWLRHATPFLCDAGSNLAGPSSPRSPSSPRGSMGRRPCPLPPLPATASSPATLAAFSDTRDAARLLTSAVGRRWAPLAPPGSISRSYGGVDEVNPVSVLSNGQVLLVHNLSIISGRRGPTGACLSDRPSKNAQVKPYVACPADRGRLT